MTSISITSSLYKTEEFLLTWRKKVTSFAEKSEKLGLKFEINAIANDPSEAELKILNELAKAPWFNLHCVPRESFYASWHRGVEVANSLVCTSWNVDDDRNPEAMLDGLRLIKSGAEIVYFPYVYKRYVKVLGLEFLAKKALVNPPEFDQKKFSCEMHCGPFFMFTKDSYQKVGPFDPSFRIAGDFDWCVRAAKIVTLRKSNVISGFFCKRVGNLSGGKNPLQEEENARIYGNSVL